MNYLWNCYNIMVKYYKTFGGKGSILKVIFDMEEIVSSHTYLFRHQDWAEINPKLVEKFFMDGHLIEISESAVFLELI